MRKVTALLLMLIVALFVVACGTDRARTADIDPIETVMNSEETYTPIANIPFIDNGSITDAWDFSEGRAWVHYRHGTSDRIAAVINTHGQIIWESDITLGSIPVGRAGSPFTDGSSFLSYQASGIHRNIIIDANGNVTFETENNRAEDFRIIAYGSGEFLAIRHISTFATNEWQIGTIDANGNEVMPFRAYESNNAAVTFVMPESASAVNRLHASRYLGENIFLLALNNGRQILLNTSTHEIIYDGEIGRFLTNFENGYALVLFPTSSQHSRFPAVIYRLNTDGSHSVVNSNWNNTWEEKNVTIYHDTVVSEGLMFIESRMAYGAYYDLFGNAAIEFPSLHDREFPGLMVIGRDGQFWGEPFINGHAVLRILGADGLRYATVINRDGEMLFEPVEDVHAGMFLSQDGRYLLRSDGGLNITMSTLENVPVAEIVTPAGLSSFENGILRSGNFFANIYDGTTIGTPSIGRRFSINLLQ